MAVTRIKNNQITDGTITGSKFVEKTITGGLLSDNLTYGSNLVVSGNLTVNGTTSTVDTTNTVIADPLLVLSRGTTGSPSVDSGFIVERGTSANVGFIWDESADVFAAVNTTEDGSTAGNITISSYANVKAADFEGTSLSIDNIDVDGNTISSTDTNGDINLTPDGSGEVVAATLTVSDLTDNRVVIAGTSGALEDSGNLTFDGSTLVVTGVANVSSNLNVSGEATLSSATVSDLTSGRVVLAGTSGAIEDSGNLTFDGTTLTVTGNVAVDNITIDGNTVSTSAGDLTLTSTGGEVTATSLAVSDLTSGRVTLAGTSGALEDSANLTFDGSTLVVTGTANVSVNLNVSGEATLASATVSDLTSGRVTLAGTSGALEDSANLTFDGTTLTVTGNVAVDNITIDGNTISSADTNGDINLTPDGTGEVVAASLTVSDLTDNRVVIAGTSGALEDDANFTFNGTTLALTAGMDITGDLDVDNLNFNGNDITSTNSNGNINITPDGTGEVIVSTLAVTDLTSGRVPYVTTNDAITDSANLTFDGTVLTTTKVTVDNISIDGDTISSAHDTITIDPSTAGVGGTVVIAGNLQVTGTTTQVDSTVVTVADPVFQIGENASDDNLDRGIKALYNNGGAKTAFFGMDDTNQEFIYIADATDSSSVFSGSLGGAAFGSLRVTDLTDNRVLIAGTSGEVEDSGNLTFDGTTLTVTGDVAIDNVTIDGNTISTSSGNLNIDSNGNEVLIDSLTVNDLTSGRVVLAGTSGAIEDSANLTFDGTTLTVTGNAAIDNITIDGNSITSTDTNGDINLTPDGNGEVVASTIAVSDLTDNRVVIAGTSGALEDDANFTFDGSALTIGGADASTVVANTDGTFSTSGEATLASATVSDLTSGRVTLAGTSGALEDSANLTFDGTTLTVSGNVAVDNVTIDGNTVSTSAGGLTLDSTSGETTVSDNLTVSGTLDVTGATNLNDTTGSTSTTTGALIVDGGVGVAENVYIGGTLNVTGESTLASATVSDLTDNRVVIAGTSGALEDSANLTFNGTTLTVSGNVAIDNITIDGNSITSSNALTLDAASGQSIVVNEAGSDVDVRIESDTQVNALFVEGSSGNIGIKTATPNAGADLHVNSTNSIIVPVGTTIQRPTGATGMIRFNSTNTSLEFYDGSSWKNAGSDFTIITADDFSGDGSTVGFTLSEDATSAGVMVMLNGVVQDPGTAYSVSGTTLTFTEAPAGGDNIDVRIITTTSTVTAISDLDTIIEVDDTAETATTTINGNVVMTVTNAAVVPGANVTYDLGSTSLQWDTIYGKATSAQYADLAENYAADQHIEPGTVVCFGGDAEVTVCDHDGDRRVAGVVSTNPAYLMNSVLEAEHVVALALQGRVPCRVVGPVRRGDMMVSAGGGAARAEADPKVGSVIGKALENFDGDTGIIEVLVGRV